MVFVPMVQRSDISPRAEELARRINEAITAYRETHPDLTGEELQQAMMRAAMNVTPGAAGSSSQRAVVLSLGVGAAVAIGLVLYLVAGQREGGEGTSWPILAIALGVIAAVAGILAIRRSAR